MKTLLKIIAVIVAFVVVVVFSFFLLLFHERSKYAATAVPYIQKVVPEIAAQWDPEVARKYTAPKVIADAPPQGFENVMRTYSQLGALKNLGEPMFLQVWADTINGTIVSYTVPATFDADNATITIRLLDTGSGFKIWLFRINSTALLQDSPSLRL